MSAIMTTYTILSFGALALLAVMILRIGAMLGTCPENGPVIRSAAVTVTTGFCAIGAGGVLLLASIFIILGEDAGFALTGVLGLAGICLGLGFTHAISILRVVAQSGKSEREKQEVSARIEPSF